MNCPKCNSVNVVQVSDLVRCQDCEHYFKPFVPVTAPPRLESGRHESSPEKIRRQANQITAFAGVLTFIGLLALIFAIGGGSTLLLVGAGMLGAACWLFLLAQIVHIRANTEK